MNAAVENFNSLWFETGQRSRFLLFCCLFTGRSVRLPHNKRRAEPTLQPLPTRCCNRLLRRRVIEGRKGWGVSDGCSQPLLCAQLYVHTTCPTAGSHCNLSPSLGCRGAQIWLWLIMRCIITSDAIFPAIYTHRKPWVRHIIGYKWEYVRYLTHPVVLRKVQNFSYETFVCNCALAHLQGFQMQDSLFPSHTQRSLLQANRGPIWGLRQMWKSFQRASL